MVKINLQEAQELRYALDDLTGYETDNSCTDPECCGGPYYTRSEFNAAVELLAKYGIEYNNP